MQPESVAVRTTSDQQSCFYSAPAIADNGRIARVVRMAGRCAGWRTLFWLSWFVNVAALIGLVTWILTDGSFPKTASALQTELLTAVRSGTLNSTFGRPASQGNVALKSVGAVAICSAVLVFLGLFVGARQHRRIRAWLLFMLLSGMWLTLWVSWEELAWQGQRWRLWRQIDFCETIATSLRSDWPTEDGEHDKLVLFLAYPRGNVQTLLRLSYGNIPGGRIAFSAVEGAKNGGLRFQLTGSESGAWLEWHPTGTLPHTFVGGLMDQHVLDRYVPLGRDWYLVRYHEARRTIRRPL